MINITCNISICYWYKWTSIFFTKLYKCLGTYKPWLTWKENLNHLWIKIKTIEEILKGNWYNVEWQMLHEY